MSTAFQGSLLDTGDDIALHSVTDGLHCTPLSRGAWVDYRPGWLAGADTLFELLHHEVPWHAERREMYERMVDVPRLLKFYDEDEVLPIWRGRSLSAPQPNRRPHRNDGRAARGPG